MDNTCKIPVTAANNVLSFEDWSKRVKAEREAQENAAADEALRRAALFDAFRL